MAGVPNAVHGEFVLPSPVLDSPSGAGPGAAGTRITGVALYISVRRSRLPITEPVTVLVEAFLMESSRFIERNRMLRVGEFNEH